MLRKNAERGFNLIEMMIGISIGLVITAAVVAFIASTLKVNSETVGSMKLSNELRALNEIIARDLRRARGMQDPLSNIGTNCNLIAGDPDACAGLGLRNITIETGCILFSYDTPSGVGRFRKFKLDTDSGNVLFETGSSELDCDGDDGSQINSPLLVIKSLNFANCTYPDPNVQGGSRILDDCIDIQTVASLRNDPENISYTYQTSVGIRSGRMD
jgi:type IV pilus assembly protein PilW